MYLSEQNSETFPTAEKDMFWKKSSWAGRHPDMIIFNVSESKFPENKLVGTYYVGILGASDSVFSIRYTTERTEIINDQNVTIKDPILLSQDKP
jgi:hypothetical protein